MGGYGDYLLVFGVAAVATFVVSFPARRLATCFGILAHPGEDHIHEHAMPTVGGGAMLIAFGVAMLVAWRLPGMRSIFAGTLEPLGVLLAAVVIFAVGLLDDVRDISAPAKVAGQVIAAMVLVFLGVTMWYWKIPFVPGIINLSSSMLPLVTALWVVGMANAVNLIDGLDGLAAGIVGIASVSLCIYALHLVSLGVLSPGTNELGPLIAAITAGVCIGFLPHNFHPARAFMGDSGAMLLGLLMAASTMLVGGRTGSTAGIDVSGLTFFRFAPLFLPFVILGVPMVDTAFAIVRRTVRRAGVAKRDLGHLHHRLIRLGHGHRRAVLILWAWSAVLSGFVLYPAFVQRANAYVPFGLGFFAVALYTVFRPGRRSGVPSATPLLAASGSAPSSGATAGPSALPGAASRSRPGAVLPARGETWITPPQGTPPYGTPVYGPELPVSGLAADGRRPAGERPPGERPAAPALPVVMSGAAGVAVAGAPELPSPPRRRRRHARSRVPRLVRRRNRIGDSEGELPG
jgi:UDP-GlcNAc:undecaprenyl-phosphate GlcNAc-1-phosphate transferase